MPRPRRKWAADCSAEAGATPRGWASLHRCVVESPWPVWTVVASGSEKRLRSIESRITL